MNSTEPVTHIYIPASMGILFMNKRELNQLKQAFETGNDAIGEAAIQSMCRRVERQVAKAKKMKKS